MPVSSQRSHSCQFCLHPAALPSPFVFPCTQRGAGSWGCSGPSPQGCPAAAAWGGAGQGSPQGYTVMLFQEATQMGTSWRDTTVLSRAATGMGTSWGTQAHNIVLCRKATQRDSLGGTIHCSALQGSNTNGDIVGEYGDTQQCFAGKQHGWGHPWDTHSDALPGSSRDRAILGTQRDTTDKQVAPGAETPARDDVVAASQEALQVQESHYCITGPIARGPGWGPSL